MIRADELIIDNFAGGGGASEGIEQALGRHIDVAINHDPEAVAMHQRNHPRTRHLCQSVWQADPVDVTFNRPVGLAWFSPDCKHFSKAKGGTPVEKHIRDLAWVVVLWAKRVRPRVIMLENVEEFRDWGPLIQTDDGKTKPCPERKGLEFRRWTKALRDLGYKVENRELRACDYGAPTSRKRLFVIARRDGQPIVWPDPTHGDPKSKDPEIRAAVAEGRLQPWRTAAEIIDWSIPCPSIFERKKPLAENTMKRIAAGVKRYVLDAAEPFIVPLTHTGDSRVHGLDEPVRTITTAKRGEFAVVAPHVTKFRSGAVGSGADEPMPTVTANSYIKRPGGCAPLGVVAASLVGVGGRMGQSGPRTVDAPYHTITAKADTALIVPTFVGAGGPAYAGKPKAADVPMNTLTTENHTALVAAFLAQHNTAKEGVNPGHDARKPVSTITSSGSHQSVVAAHLLNMKGSARRTRRADEPAPAVCAGGTHIAEVRAFLVKYFGTATGQAVDEPLHTVTSKHRFGLVTIQGVDYVIADIGMRMLMARELYGAQGFPPDYEIEFEHEGRPLPKSSQVRMCGNSVSPYMSRALVAANFAAAAQEVA